MAPPQILVVSAEPTTVELVERQLAAHGFRAVLAKGPDQAMRQLAENHVDLTIVDLSDAETDALCKLIQTDPTAARLPLIAATGPREDSQAELQGRERGISDYIRRPIRERDLIARVKGLLRIADSQREGWMLNRLAQSERLVTLGQLAASVAHEINNPLAFILSNLNTLHAYYDDLKKVLEAYRRGPEEGKATEEGLQLSQVLADMDSLLRETADGGRRVRGLVAELKSLARPDAGQLEPVDLAEVAAATLVLTERELSARARVVKALQPAPIAQASRSKLHQVVLNLLVNASQALDGKSAEGNEIRVVTRTDGNDAVLSISDTGCGIPPEQRSRIFELFFTTKPPSVGTGIGLSICSMVIQKMGGTIEVESAPGRGSTFTVRVPAESVAGG